MEQTGCIICEKQIAKPYLQLNDRLQCSPDLFQLVQCSCQMVYLNPRPKIENIAKYYQSADYDPHVETNKKLWNQIYHFIQQFTLRWKYYKIAPFITSGRLLDIGGGRGEFAVYLKKKGWEVMLQDELTQRENMVESKGIKSVQHLADLKESQYFNVITLWHSLEHIHQISDLFQNISRLLKPNGILVVAVPNLNAPERVFYKRGWAPFDAPRHLYHFQTETLIKLCQRYGFQVYRKISMYQDTPYNILLSISQFTLVQALKAGVVTIYSTLKTLIKGPDYSSSILIICKKF